MRFPSSLACSLGLSFCVVLSAVFFLSAAPALALPFAEGKIVRGSYLVSGKVPSGSVTVRYLPSRVVTVNPNGRIRGQVFRQVFSRGVLIEAGNVRVRGQVRNLTLRKRQRTFTAPTVIRVDGSIFRGTFSGLAEERLTRVFRGKVNGNRRSNLVLRAR